ncbi:MAG: tetratricopeptide repeat protein [Nitrospinae bacterium]|nr:tetratricopeptide repeat protein [Nitrospinota bacterium]
MSKQVVGWKGTPAYWEKLVEIYTARCALDRNSYYYIPLADALASLGKVDEAIEALELGVALTTPRRAAMVLLAQLYYDKGDKDKARRILIPLVERWPDVCAGVVLLCKLYEQEGKHIEADNLARRLEHHYPNSRYVHSLVERYDRLAREALIRQAVERDERQRAHHTHAAARRNPARRAPDGRQEQLFALESMLSNIGKLRDGED